MRDNATSNIKITYYSRCLGDGPEIETSKCDGLKKGSTVSFAAEIVVLSCPGNRSEWNQMLEIYPVGMHEKLIIDLEMICDCDCDREGTVPQAPECKGHGTLKCGVCECDKDFFGRRCECSA